ncbi:hypothetical protein NL676_011975 [Syzygium grande]|nr:hypothetical protein NL676_011975 [Syzygium grande]
MANSTRDYSVRKWLKTLLNHDGRDSPPEVRAVLLVVATLIAAVTFQAGVNPPGGVWQENKDGRTAGRAIYASDEKAFFVFLTSNTLALSSSILLIISLTWGFPFFLEVIIATVSMVMTYGASIFAITPTEAKTVKFRYLLFIAAVPVVLRVVIQICKYVALFVPTLSHTQPCMTNAAESSFAINAVCSTSLVPSHAHIDVLCQPQGTDLRGQGTGSSDLASGDPNADVENLGGIKLLRHGWWIQRGIRVSTEKG